MRASSVVHLYRVRLKARAVLIQELLAVSGLAVGVALLFASHVASASLNGSVAQLTTGVVGQAQYQLAARGPSGLDQKLSTEIRGLKGVKAAVAVLDTRVGVTGSSGQQTVDLVAGEPGSLQLTGPLLRDFGYSVLAGEHAVALPAPIARSIGARSLQPVTLEIEGRLVRTLLATTLQAPDIGALVNSPVAFAPLGYAQALTGMRGRVTRVFVQVRAGYGRAVRTELTRLAAGHLNVEPANFDATLFDQAAAPIDQSTNTFAAICALIGFMFASCAMLLTKPLRQALIRGLRANGASRLDILEALLFDALALALLACAAGLVLGELLSLAISRSQPDYLAIGFPIGSQRIVTWQSVAVACAGGLLGACVGVLLALRDAPSSSPRKRAAQSRVPRGWRLVELAGGVLGLGATTFILLAAPQLAILGIVTLIAALLCLMPSALDGLVAAFQRVQSLSGWGWSRLAVVELRSSHTRPRSLAIAATGAVAVFGAVTIQGSHANLQRGLDVLVHQLSVTSDLWVVPPGTQSLLATTSFRNSSAHKLAQVAGVQSVAAYRSGLLDFGHRRVWVLAPPASARDPIPGSQLLSGDIARARRRLAQGGWAVLSQAVASENHLRVGQRFVLPSPNPSAFRVAALTTNLGWPPGAIILGPQDYVRAWGSSDPSAYNLMLRPHISVGQGLGEVRRALGAHSGFIVQSAHEREMRQRAAGRQGLARLTQISVLMWIAGVLAIATAMGAMVWERRRRFARMKVQGYQTSALWYSLLCETALLLGAGCLVGGVFGIYGQLLLSHALLSVTGFPVVFSSEIPVAATSFALVTAAAAAIVAIPGYLAARVAPYV
jgi:putative ABC transport system permease protein